MGKDVAFSLDTKGGEEILQRMAAPTVKQAAEAIAARARSMSQSMTSHPPTIAVTNSVGTIKRGVRAISTISAEGDDPHAQYVGHISLRKAKDAGRVKS